jgi:DNA modification methylase
LRRLLEACTAPGDRVLDPYLGSGTTLAVCHALGRKAVGIDESSEALQVARRRLRALGVQPLEERAVAAEVRPALNRARARRAPAEKVA